MTTLEELYALQAQVAKLKQQLYDGACGLLAREVKRLCPAARAIVLDTEADRGYRWYFLGGVYTAIDAEGQVVGEPIELSEEVEEQLQEVIALLSADDPGWLTIPVPEGAASFSYAH